MTATQTQATTTTIPLNKLIASADNVRRTGGGTGIDELAASISAHGVLQNLIVRFPEDDAKGRYEVIAGGRRLACTCSPRARRSPRPSPCLAWCARRTRRRS